MAKLIDWIKDNKLATGLIVILLIGVIAMSVVLAKQSNCVACPFAGYATGSSTDPIYDLSDPNCPYSTQVTPFTTNTCVTPNSFIKIPSGQCRKTFSGRYSVESIEPPPLRQDVMDNMRVTINQKYNDWENVMVTLTYKDQKKDYSLVRHPTETGGFRTYVPSTDLPKYTTEQLTTGTDPLVLDKLMITGVGINKDHGLCIIFGEAVTEFKQIRLKLIPVLE